MRNDLIEAYVGHYEEEPDMLTAYAQGDYAAHMSYEVWLKTAVVPLIKSDTPKRRLEIYLEWNGIIGYSESIFAIATGET